MGRFVECPKCFESHLRVLVEFEEVIEIVCVECGFVIKEAD